MKEIKEMSPSETAMRRKISVISVISVGQLKINFQREILRRFCDAR